MFFSFSTFALHVIEIFLQNTVLKLYIRRWPSWRHVSLLRHIGWFDYDRNFSRGWDSPGTKCQPPQKPGNYVPLTLYVEILFCANVYIDWRGVTSVQGGILADCDQIDTHVPKWNSATFEYPKFLHNWATGDWGIPSKLRFDAIYPSVAILVSRQFRATYWLITTKTLVVDGTLLTQSFSFLKDREFMCHSPYTWNSCSGPTLYGPRIDCRGSTSVQGGILADYDQIDTHVLKWNPAKFGYPKSFHIRATRDWVIPSKLRFDAIYPSVAILASLQFGAAYWLIQTSRGWNSPDTKYQPPQRPGNYVPLTLCVEIFFLRLCLTDTLLPDVVARQFRAAYWLITTNYLVVGRTLLTQSFSFLNDREFVYHSTYMWKFCSGPTPYGPHIDWRGVTSIRGYILADYDQNFIRWWHSPVTKFQLRQWPWIYVPLTLYVEILFRANALRTPYWLTWCHVSSGRHIGWLRPNWYPRPEVKSCQVWLS